MFIYLPGMPTDCLAYAVAEYDQHLRRVGFRVQPLSLVAFRPPWLEALSYDERHKYPPPDGRVRGGG